MTRPKFAVVREDPDLEASLFTRALSRPRATDADETRGAPHGRVLVVASGGCTALTLASRFPDVEVVAFDLSTVALGHAAAKERAVLARDPRLGATSDDPRSLLQCGEFEGLFRTLRHFVEEFVAPPEAIARFFGDLRGDANSGARAALVSAWTTSRYWPVAFELALHDGFLHAMFGPDATRHAEPGSYPRYFQRAFEGALARGDAPENPFLQHVLLGRYLEDDAPDYLHATRFGRVTWLEGDLLAVPALDRFDVVSLSNVFDWSDDALVERWAGALVGCAEGTAVLLRFLNNGRSVRRFFEPAFTFDDATGRDFLARDRSFFYERIEVAVRR